MNSHAWSDKDLNCLLGSPVEFETKAGYRISTHSASWQLEKGLQIYIPDVTDFLRDEDLCGFVRALSHLAKTKSSSLTCLVFHRIRHFLKSVGGGEITTYKLISYRSQLARETEWYLGTVRGFFYTWFKLGYPGISKDVIALLKGMRLKGNIKGDAVQRADPSEGPLTDNELCAFNECAVRGFEIEAISLAELVVCLLISHTGRRPRQIAYMKICDLLDGARNVSGEDVFVVAIPRSKQRGQHFRETFKHFRVTRDLWVLLRVQGDRCIEQVENTVGFKLGDKIRSLLPLIPDINAFKGICSEDSLCDLLASDRLHIKPRSISDILRRVVGVTECISERTGVGLDVVPRRFRYTKGTRAAREGFGVAVIAEILDHTDTQSAGVYTKNIPDHVAVLDEAIGHLVAPFAQAFRGVLVDSGFDAVRGDDPSSRIRYKGVDAATCGKYGKCGANVPIPCYTCHHFQPWLYGPHEAIYERLIEERQRVLEETNDSVIAEVNDRTILAVAEVIRQCKERLASREEATK